MKKESKIQLTIRTTAIGDVVMELPYTQSIKGTDFILEIPNSMSFDTTYTKLNLSHVVQDDIKHFIKLNEISDNQHQIHIDTLCIYGLKIEGSSIRIQYWFDQFKDNSCHRMCAGQLTRCYWKGSHNNEFNVYPDCYSSDVCVYW